MDRSAASQARAYVRVAIVFPAVAVLFHFLLSFVPGLLRGEGRGRMGGHFVVSSIAFLIAFPAALVLLWSLGLPIILFVSRLCHLVFGGRIPINTWQETTCNALWPLPYAFGAASFAYIIYHLFHFGGWPDDVIFGTIGNILGAWCYLTICWSWYKLRRPKQPVHTDLGQAAASRPSAPDG